MHKNMKLTIGQMPRHNHINALYGQLLKDGAGYNSATSFDRSIGEPDNQSFGLMLDAGNS